MSSLFKFTVEADGARAAHSAQDNSVLERNAADLHRREQRFVLVFHIILQQIRFSSDYHIG
jgi:hypothetical protein